MMKRILSLALLALPLFAAGCSKPEPSWAGSVRDSAGITLVENTEVGLWGDGEGWRLVEELRIGGLGGDPEYQFGQVGTPAVDSAGNLFVPDAQAQEVRVYSPEGHHIRTIGRPGHGPGELSLSASVALLAPGDTLLVPDLRNRTIHRFLADGTVLEAGPLQPEEGRPLRYNRTAGRTSAVQVRPLASSDGPAGGTEDAILAVETTGHFGDTLLVLPSGGMFEGPGIRNFTPEPWWALTDSVTVVYGINSEYRVMFYDVSRTLRRIVTYPREAVPITDRDIRAFFAYLDRAWLRAGVAPSQLAANHQAVSFNETLPVYTSFHIGPEGSLWVQPVRSPGEMSDEEIERYNFVEDFGGPDWEVFDSAGRYLGVITMPERFTPRLFLGDLIYGVQRDELDVQYVVRLRIEK